MPSKARQSFETKVNYFLDDIELLDVLRISVLKNDLTDQKSQYVLAKVNPNRHSHLERRANSDKSRELVINHLRSTVYGSFVKNVYEEVMHYMKTILEQAAQSGFDGGRMIGEHSFSTDAQTLLRLGSWEEVCKYVAEAVFQALENERSSLKLLQKISTKLGLGVPDCVVDDLKPYLEIRHFLVHSDGRVNADFQSSNPTFTYTIDDKVIVNYQFVIDFWEKSRNLIEIFDTAIIDKNLLNDQFTQP